MDEGPVEAVIPLVELEVEAQRVCQETDDRVRGGRAFLAERIVRAGRWERLVRGAAGSPRKPDDMLWA